MLVLSHPHKHQATKTTSGKIIHKADFFILFSSLRNKNIQLLYRYFSYKYNGNFSLFCDDLFEIIFFPNNHDMEETATK